MKRLQAALSLFFAVGHLSGAAYAADGSIPDTITNAFETVVIDARTAAEKAASAAKGAIVSDANAEKAEKKAKPDKKAAKAKQDPTKKKDEPKEAAGPAPTKGEPSKDDPATVEHAKDAKDAGNGGKPAEADKKKSTIATEWPAVDVELGRARCNQLLKGIDAVTLPEPPLRKGDCGSPAPVRLISIGKNPEVALSPPAVVSCDMVVALSKWIKQDVQPAARRHLGAEVIKMESMSDYSCRMAYGRIGNKLSEHGKANALDIRGFMTSKGKTAVVLADWGPNKRDIAKEIAVAQAAAAKAAAEKSATEQAVAAADDVSAGASAVPRKTLAEGLPSPDRKSDLATPAALKKETFGGTPTHLGGPRAADGNRPGPKPSKKAADKAKKNEKPETVAALPGAAGPGALTLPPKKPLDASGKFLHAIHAAACNIFGTTLGPEANEAHRNHFHVDMAERKHKKICD